MSSEEITDQELGQLIGESPCAARPAPTNETLSEYLERIAREDGMRASAGDTAARPLGPITSHLRANPNDAASSASAKVGDT